MFKIISCCILTLPAFAQNSDTVITKKAITINGQKIVVIKTSNEPVYKNGHIVKGKFENSKIAYYKNKKLIFEQTIRERNDDCNSAQIQLGKVEARDSIVKVYNYEAWVGGCCSGSFGASTCTYTFSKNGTVKISDSKIYLEPRKSPYLKMPKEALSEWIANTETEYNAKFIKGAAAKKLIKKVKRKLMKQITIDTKGWKTWYANYKRYRI